MEFIKVYLLIITAIFSLVAAVTTVLKLYLNYRAAKRAEAGIEKKIFLSEEFDNFLVNTKEYALFLKNSHISEKSNSPISDLEYGKFMDCGCELLVSDGFKISDSVVQEGMKK